MSNDLGQLGEDPESLDTHEGVVLLHAVSEDAHGTFGVEAEVRDHGQIVSQSVLLAVLIH